MRWWCLQHVAHEGPAAIGDVLAARGIELVQVRLDRGDALPSVDEVAGLVVMGGPMGADDDADHPYLAEERSLIGDCVGRDLPVLGMAGVPADGVTAVAVNLTAVEIDQPAYVQALPTWRASAGGYSNINTDHPAQTRANFAIVPIGEGGTISLYTIAAGHLVVDVLGYFTASEQPVAAGRFVHSGAPTAAAA